MAIIGVPAISAPGIPVDTSRALPVRDPAMAGASNNGVRAIFDLAFPWCYPGGSPIGRPDPAAPANGAVIYDMAERANGSIAVPAGTISYAGGGIDFTNSQVTGVGATLDAGLIFPASVLADIWTAFGGSSQQYLFSMWCKLPSAANWNASATLQSMAGDKPYMTAASLFTLAQLASGQQIQVRRQTAAATYDTTNQLAITPNAADYGSVVQLAHWRNASGQFLRLRSPNGTILATRAVGADNTQNFSGNTFCVGRNGQSFGGAGVGVLTAMSGFRVYRAYMENLARSGRDPVAALDAAYAAITARNPFS